MPSVAVVSVLYTWASISRLMLVRRAAGPFEVVGSCIVIAGMFFQLEDYTTYERQFEDDVLTATLPPTTP